MLKLTTNKHEAARGLSATAELLVSSVVPRSGSRSDAMLAPLALVVHG